MGDRLEGKVAVITGSTGGIGASIARRLAAEGIRVVVSGRRFTVGEEVARGIRDDGGEAIFVRADVAVEADCVNLIHEAARHFGQLSILVNNAAIFPRIPFERQTAETWDRELTINLRSAFLCAKTAIPFLREQQNSSIVNIGSTIPYIGTAGNLQRLAYAVSKGGLLTMTKTMARALLKDRIRVNWVTVGWVATPGEVVLRDKSHESGEQFLRKRGEEAPLGRLETAEEIAAGVAYLVSDEASHVTGCELNISGGLFI